MPRQISVMQTTLRMDDRLYRRAKAKSSELGMSLTRFLEEAVEYRLEHLEHGPRDRIVLPVSSVSGSPMSSGQLSLKITEAELEDDLQHLE